MKRSIAVFIVLFSAVVQADEASTRPRVVVDESLSRQNDARLLVEEVAEACTAGNSRAFLSHFTSRYGRSIRSKIRETFASQDMEMRILEVILDSGDDHTLAFEAKYVWTDATGTSVITSDVVAKREEGRWKIDGETILGRKPDQSFDTETRELAITPIRFLKPGDPDWDPDSPKDIPQIPGSCRGGKCGLVRQDAEPPIEFLTPDDPDWDPESPKDIPQVRASCKGGQCRAP